MKNKIGVDIGAYSIKCSTMIKLSDKNIIEEAEEYQTSDLKYAIKDFAKKNKIRFPKYYLSINDPSPELITKIFTISADNKKEVIKGLPFEIEERTAVTIDNYYLKHDILDDAEGYTVIASILNKGNKPPVKSKVIEPQVVSLSRLTEGDCAVIDLGHMGTRVYVYQDGKPYTIHSSETGQKAITEKIAKYKGISKKEAQEIKHSKAAALFGMEHLEEDPDAIEIFEQIAEDLEAIARDVKQSLRSMEVEGVNIDTIYYTGGGGYLNYYPEYLSNELNMDLKPLSFAESTTPKEDYPFSASTATLIDGLKGINFAKTRQVNLKTPVVVLAGALVFSQLFLGYQIYNINQETEAIEEKVVVAEHRLGEYQNKLQEYEAETVQKDKIKPLIEEITEQEWKSEVLFILPEKIPRGVEIKEIEVADRTTIRGEASNYADIGFFALEIRGQIENIKGEGPYEFILNLL